MPSSKSASYRSPVASRRPFRLPLALVTSTGLPPFTPGDVVALDDGDGPILVTSARGNLKGRRLATGDRYEADVEEGIAPDARKIADRADAEPTTLVAVEDAHAVQVLDPDTYESTTVPRPDYLDPDAEAVPVIKHRRGLHVLPEE